jgi:sugar phosphate isomerase/epimerase
MHPRISLNTLSLGAGSLAANAELAARIGAPAISPGLEEVGQIGPAKAATILRDAGLQAATFTHRAFAFADPAWVGPARERLHRTIDMAAAIGASSITMTTGGRASLAWCDAVDAFAHAIAPCAAHALAAGVALAVEPTSHLYADASIAHRLHDLVSICEAADVGLGIDLFACWFDADIDQAIAAAAPRTAVVQVSDYVAGDRALPCRAVPGDGIAAIDRLVPLIARAGFQGWFDLEIIGPRIEAEGAERALLRAAERLGSWIGAGDAHSVHPG